MPKQDTSSNKNILGKLLDHDKRFNDHDKRFERIKTKLLEHDEQFERIKQNMVTKAEFSKAIDLLEGIAAVVAKLDQERFATKEWIRRIEAETLRLSGETKAHTAEILRIKHVLKLA